MSKILETKCQMKYTVIELVRQRGKPTEEYSKKLCGKKEPGLTKDFILEQLHQGKTLKQIAKENGLSKGSVGYWSKYIYNIDARQERKENAKWEE